MCWINRGIRDVLDVNFFKVFWIEEGKLGEERYFFNVFFSSL